MVTARDALQGTLDANESIGPFHVRGHLAADSGVLTIIGDVIAAGGGTVTIELYADAGGTKGGSTFVTMTAATGYIAHLVASPDTWIKLTMTARDTDDIDFYLV